MALGDVLVACHHTLSGADARSPARLPFRDRVAAAAAAGFTGIGLMWLDYQQLVECGQSPPELRAIVDDHGISVIEVEFLNDWWAADDGDAAVLEHERLVFEMAGVFGARHLNVGASVPADQAPSRDLLAARFGRLCRRAAEHGLLVGLEFMPFFVLADAHRAWQLVQDSDAANAGVVIDAYHWSRGGGDVADLRVIPADRVVAVQLSDGPAVSTLPMLDETLDHRWWPGDGQFELTQLLRALADFGVDAPVEVEVLNAQARSWPAEALAARAYDAVRSSLAAAFG